MCLKTKRCEVELKQRKMRNVTQHWTSRGIREEYPAYCFVSPIDYKNELLGTIFTIFLILSLASTFPLHCARSIGGSSEARPVTLVIICELLICLIVWIIVWMCVNLSSSILSSGPIFKVLLLYLTLSETEPFIVSSSPFPYFVVSYTSHQLYFWTTVLSMQITKQNNI